MLLSCWLLLLTRAGAATVLSGNVSGTWTTNGSPYILSADCTVASNQTLTILPGVEVIIGPDVSVEVLGGLSAVGTAAQPISIRGANPTNYWGSIGMYNSTFPYRFNYCRIRDSGYQPLVWGVDGGNRRLTAEVVNCDFLNCRYGGVYGIAQSHSSGDPASGKATLAIEVRNCIFDSTGNGCVFGAFYIGPNAPDSTIEARVIGNLFKNLKETALLLYESHNNAGGTNSSRPEFVNNTIISAQRGVDTVYPYFNPTIRNNMFIRTSNAVHNLSSSGPGSFDVSYNCFFSNTANFSGYPGIYGIPVINNHNGDPCDAFYNIFLDPQFLDTNRFLLRNSSPCIDAGDPTIADVCFQFSRGSAISDIGAYGGPEVCGWLTHGFAPVITAPPLDQSSCVGGSATFNVRVEGSEPLAYRWYFGPTPLAGETNAQLTLANLQANQAGLYSVTVSNGFGSVASAPARLVVSDACVGIHAYAGLSITGLVGRTYNVEYVTNLAATNWTFVASNTFTQPAWLFLDTNTPVNVRRFFRVRLLP